MSITKDPDPSGLSQILGEVETQLQQMDPDQYSSGLRTELEEAMEQARAYMQQAQMIQKKCDQLEEKIREPESETSGFDPLCEMAKNFTEKGKSYGKEE